MPESHANDLSPEDRALLAADVPTGSTGETPPPPEPIDWQAAVMRIAERSRPHREAQRAARERRERILADQRAARTRDINRQRSAAQIPARYRHATADHPVVTKWIANTLRGGTDSLILNGPVGCGKTWQAYGAWRVVAEHTGCRAVAVPVPALLDSLRPGRTPLAALEDVERAELLLLDDLAAERITEWTEELVYRLIDARWNACLPTIITVNAPNMPGHTLRERMGHRIASRLNGLGVIASWPADAPDRRAPSTDT